MEANRPDRIGIALAGRVVEISRGERDLLLRELALVPGSRTLRAEFARAGTGMPVELDRGQRTRLRTVLEAWAADAYVPDGITHLLAALTQAEALGE
jgi:hypothetical protein